MSALDVLFLAPLPCRVNGRAALQVGATVQCAALASGLAERRHRVRVISTYPPEQSGLEPGDTAPGVEVDWFAVEMLSTRRPPEAAQVQRRRAQFEAALERALPSGRPDVVIFGNESHPWYAAEVCRAAGLATVLVAQGVPTAGLPGGIYPPSGVRALTDQLRKVDLIVPVSAQLEEILRELGLTRLRTIETGIDTELFQPGPKDPDLLETHDIPPEGFVVGSFAHMRPEKRLADLVESAEIALRTEPHLVYLIAGDGPGREAVVALVEERGLAERFRFVGELTHHSVARHMTLCDAVVVASEREGFCLVAYEAQASGRAVVASDIPAGRAAAEGGGALLFELGDAGDLAAKTVTLARDEPLRRSLGERGRAATVASSRGLWIDAWCETLTALRSIGRGGMNQLALTGHGDRLAVRKRYTVTDTSRRKPLGSGARNEALLGPQLGDLVPQELRVETSSEHEDVYLAWRGGTALGPGEIDADGARSAGAALARIHGVTGEWHGSIDGRHRFDGQPAAFAFRWPLAVDALREGEPELADELARWARAELARLRWSPPALVHGDFGATNVLWAGSEVSAVLDWEYARFGDPREDWAKVALGIRFPEPNSFGAGEALLAALREGYLAAGGAAEAVQTVAIYEAYYAALLARVLGSAEHLGWLAGLVR